MEKNIKIIEEKLKIIESLCTDECINKGGIYVHGIYSALKRKEVPTQVTTQVNFEDINLSEISQTQRTSTYMQCLEQSDLQRQTVEWWLPRAGGEEWGGSV